MTEKRQYLIAALMLAGATGFWAAFSWGDHGFAEQRENIPRQTESSQQPAKLKESIAETKKKGFDGVDFSYDVFGAPSGQDPVKISEQVKTKDIADKPKVLGKQKQLLAERYKLDCRTQPSVTMTKGKPQPLGPTTQLKNGLTWEKLSGLDAEEIKNKKLFPAGFHRLPHVKHEAGGMVFPAIQLKQFPRLERFDVEFDLPECFLPEFPPPIFLTTHPELGDVSQGEVLDAENFDRLFRGLRHAGTTGWAPPFSDAVPSGGIQRDARPKNSQAQLGRVLSRLPCQFSHHRAIPFEPGYPAPDGSVPYRHHEPSWAIQSADSRLQT